MRKHGLPKELRQSVRAQYRQQWERGISFNQSEIIERLSYSLRKKVQLHLKKSVIGKIPFFADASDGLIFELCSKLLPLTVNIGEDGTRM